MAASHNTRSVYSTGGYAGSLGRRSWGRRWVIAPGSWPVSWLAARRGFGEWISAKILGRCGFATFFRLCLAVFMGRPVITLGPFITFWSLVMLRSVIALRPISRF